MNGLEFLEKIMRLRPMPVIMVSTLTSAAPRRRSQALEIGAVDCVAKPRPGNEHAFDELPTRSRSPRGARAPAASDERPNAQPHARGGRTSATDPDGRSRRDRLIDRRRRGADRAPVAVSRRIARRPSSPSICRRPSPRASRSASTASARPRCRRRRRERRSRPARSIWRPAATASRTVAVPATALPAASTATGQRPPALGRRAVQFGGACLRPQCGRRDPDRHGPRRRRGAARNAQRRRPHVGQNEATCVVYGMPRRRSKSARSRSNCRLSASRRRSLQKRQHQEARRPIMPSCRKYQRSGRRRQVRSRLLLSDGCAARLQAVHGRRGRRSRAEDDDAEQPCHLVISDFNMPKMDGSAPAGAAQQAPTRRRLHHPDGQGRRALVRRQKWGLNNLLAKPFTSRS